jgi:NAD(P)-dependent dehydrogenase (short-subunit alcohol dehydrogenase family)
MSGHVVITGASAGVGRATANAFAAEGWRVTLLARDAGRLAEAVAQIEREGGAALSVPTDVADPDAVEAAAEAAERSFGEIGVWVNSAMVTVYSPVSMITAEEFRRVTEVTYLGQVYGTMSALRRMRRHNRGTIVNVSSALAYHGLPLQAAYCGAKFAARGFTESLRSELLHDASDIRVTLVILPAVNTPQFDWARNKLPRRPRPVPPVYQPEVIAAAIVRAAKTAPRELVIGRSSLQLVAGSMVAPGFVDKVLASMAYGGQQSSEPAEAGADNLFEPAPGDFASHGRFDEESRRTGSDFALGTVRVVSAAVATALVIGLACAAYAIGRGRNRTADE